MTHDCENQVRQLRASWIGGGPVKPLIQELIRLKRMDEAGALARLTLSADECQDREEVEKLLEQTSNPPPGWTEAVAAFSLNPTAEHWDRLMRFTPDDFYYQRTRNTLRILRRIGTDPNTLFRCATRQGTVPDAFELVQSGEVDPEAVVERAQEAPPEARALWLGLAAEAAFARGDDLNTVRLLRLAYAEATDRLGLEMSAMAIRANAGQDLQEMLDKVGIPRFES